MKPKYDDAITSELEAAVSELEAKYSEIDVIGEYTPNQIANAHMSRIQDMIEIAINMNGPHAAIAVMNALHKWVEEMIDQIDESFPGSRQRIESLEKL